MSKEINDGGPAYPQPCTSEGYAGNTPYGVAGGGMTLRDWYAGMALQGICASNPIIKGLSQGTPADDLCKLCYILADAMIKQRGKKP